MTSTRLHPQSEQACTTETANGISAIGYSFGSRLQRVLGGTLSKVDGMPVQWDTASLVTAERVGDEMVLQFDKPVMPHDMPLTPEGFSIAGADGKYFKAYARFRLGKKNNGIWNSAKSCDTTLIRVWSPLVPEPVGVRYGWARSPMVNLYAEGKPWAPLANFRTDEWDWPESDDPAVSAVDRSLGKQLYEEAQQRNAHRVQREVELAAEIGERHKRLGRAKKTE